MRIINGVNDERIQMAKISYLKKRIHSETLHEPNSMVMRKLNEDVSKNRMFKHIKMLVRKEERKYKNIKLLIGSRLQ